eukprot:CAMPEP_0118981814 /NCGR_PEP_ID=MMETSP1173-20130426/31397_1 /TAXON_ID=1034831 /ORGANISM="Rhizochromulina marina cf, Strain CCMP1243" /LENGTH=684 /DNA_ID=CAMNT_0006932267 /DNA_START=18 /DNA_END=2068 /DNA_ORIENTATION=-
MADAGPGAAEESEVAALRRQVEELRQQLASANLRANLSAHSIAAPPSELPNDPFSVPLHTIVVFGADGNLSLKKTFPALFALMRQRHLPASVNLIGYARDKFSNREFQDLVFRAIYNVTIPQAERTQFLSRISFQQGQFNDATHFAALRKMIEEREIEQETSWLQQNGHVPTPPPAPLPPSPSPPNLSASSGGTQPRSRRAKAAAAATASMPPQSSADQAGGHSSDVGDPASLGIGQRVLVNFRHIRTFYLAVPPFLYPGIAECCQAVGLCRGPDSFDRFILEKPFGKDTASCIELCAKINRVLAEGQVYRIDHYLGKELVMNVLVLRFANIAFNAIWDRNHIASVQVVCKEKIGTEGRGGYFDEYGIIRDVMQNHLLQILALVAMEQPLSLSADHIRQEKVKLLDTILPLEVDDVLVGQYVSNGRQKGYIEDPTITNKHTNTETYATAVLKINNPRWSGVPFILKAGKALDESKVEVRIRFQPVPGIIPALADCAENELVIRVQPHERIFWKITSKVPGLDFSVETRRMDLLYSYLERPLTSGLPATPADLLSSSTKADMPGAYDRLILEVLRGDQTNFVHADELVSSWRIFSPALHALATSNQKPHPYTYGSPGPLAETQFALRYGFPDGFGNEMDQNSHRQPIAWGTGTEKSFGSALSGPTGGVGGGSSSSRGDPGGTPGA